MTRTTRRKILCVLTIILIIGSFEFLFGEGEIFALTPKYHLALVWVIVIIANIPAFAYRKMFAARRLARQGKNDDAAAKAREFIKEMETNRCNRLACKLALEVYTDKPEVHGYLCLARAICNSGDVTGAMAISKRAAEIDPLCPTVYLSLAIMAKILGDEFMTNAYLDRARELGYSRSLSDRVFLLGGEYSMGLVLLLPKKKE